MERLDSLVVKTSPRSWEGLGSNPGPAIILEFNIWDVFWALGGAVDVPADVVGAVGAACASEALLAFLGCLKRP